MKKINLGQMTLIGGHVTEFTKQLIHFLNCFKDIHRMKLNERRARKLIAETAKRSRADIEDLQITQEMIGAIQSGAITEVSGEFNGIVLTANSKSTPESLYAFYNTESERRRIEYRNSPEGKAAAKEQEDRRLNLQSEHDSLMKQLPNLDFTDKVALLEWLCKIQPSTDHIGVKQQTNEIVSAFNKNGYITGANCGKDFKKDDEDNFARYIIGQALSCLESVGAIHHMVSKFAEDWKDKFHKQVV